MQNFEFIQITPEQLKEQIREQLQEQFQAQTEKLKKQLQAPTPPEYLTRHETAKLLKVDLSTVHNWTKKGILKRYGIGNRVYYKFSEIEKAIQEF
ncbi:helix-turn-helix domain-containing protein [Marinilabilia rubra]|uniref:DNA-binding protein n=1 Tax=Marinilabilia rubra TaxID=2162893 RepID=A0A2U2BD92_9BACT|nr:helix-turn-helix domain-containing protein [Marinilabilia rubra]PWE00997.1 DNA-binding protein [Marinilabilia rubra]